MATKVFYADMHCRKNDDNKLNKIERLCKAVELEKFIKADDLTAIKLHFGEMGNDTHINPSHVRRVVDLVKRTMAKPFLTDTNTLYSGSRRNAIDHLHTAFSHGFVPSVVDAPVIIADGIDGKSQVTVPVSGLKHFTETYIAREIHDAHSMVVLSHVKGHEMAGFGGAIKNLAMGCASFWGKRAQHDTKIKIDEKLCIACGECLKICPSHAINYMKNDDKKIAKVNKNQCIGCFECVTVCEQKAIGQEFETELFGFVERIAEYAYGAVQGKENKIVYINFVTNVTPDCDCVSWSDAPMIPDVGILASTDPVAIDKASYDLVKQSTSVTPMENNGINIDKFSQRWGNTHGYHQIEHGAAIGLGSLEYELVLV